MNIQAVYNPKDGSDYSKKTKDQKDRLFKKIYKVGRYMEPEKRDVMLRDLEKKQNFIIALLIEKENLEEQLVSFSCIHDVYVRYYVQLLTFPFQKSYKDIQEDIKGDIKKFMRDKHQIQIFMENIADEFDKHVYHIGK